MEEIPGIVITGVSGRMGRMLVGEVQASPVMRLIGAIERPGHEWIGKDLGEAMGGQALGVTVTDDALEAMAEAQALIDFTAPEATVANAAICAQARAVHVVGTTGLSEEHIAKLNAAARHATIIRAGNMSLGVNLLVQRHKVDAPSGTALMLGEAAAEGRGVRLTDVSDSGRDGITGARGRGHIGFAAIRGGDIVGEHDVIFAAPGERVVLRHIATDRRIFARGALKAALWGQGRGPGAFDMLDVLGLK